MADKGEKIVGAKAKLARARQLNALGMLDVKSGAYMGGAKERIYSTLLTVFLAGLVAWRLGDGLLKSGTFKSGIALIDDMVLAPAPIYIGDTQMDWAIALVIRTCALLAVAGIIPALSWMWAELVNRPMMNPYRIVWAMILVVAVIALFMEPVLDMITSNLALLANQ